MIEFIALMKTGLGTILAVVATAFIGWIASLMHGAKREAKGKEQAENKQRVIVAEKTTEIIKRDREIEKESDGMSTSGLLDSLYELDEDAGDSK